jgi:hypothetical protein
MFESVFALQTERTATQTRFCIGSSEVRFEVKGYASTITGMSVLTSNDGIRYLQANCPDLAILHEHQIK